MDQPELMEGRKGTAVGKEPEQIPQKESEKKLSGAAARALAEAMNRRLTQKAEDRPKEISGFDGLDPVRYGDWEKNGLISDF
jgi:hypothetical protein